VLELPVQETNRVSNSPSEERNSDFMHKIQYYPLRQAPISKIWHLQALRDTPDGIINFYKQEKDFNPKRPAIINEGVENGTFDIEELTIKKGKIIKILNINKMIDMGESFYQPIYLKQRKTALDPASKALNKPKRVDIERMKHVVVIYISLMI